MFREVPRRNWKDCVPLEIKPLGDGRIMIDLYPFNEAPLTVSVPARVAETLCVVATGTSDSEGVHMFAEVVWDLSGTLWGRSEL